MKTCQGYDVLEPDVGSVLDALRRTDLKGVLMFGSGSTCFGLAKSRREAQVVAARLSQVYPEWWVCASCTR